MTDKLVKDLPLNELCDLAFQLAMAHKDEKLGYMLGLIRGHTHGLLNACTTQHDAIDRLLAELIATKPGFMPTAHPAWNAAVAGHKALRRARGEAD